MFGGPIRLIEHYLPKMRERRAEEIMMISSIDALLPVPKFATYAEVKSGIYAYGISLNAKLSDDNISVTVSLRG